MKSKLVLLIAIFVSLGIIYAIFNAEKKQINANEQPTKQNQVCVKLVYDKPIDGYEVTADWQPFEVKDCETGYITINFRDISTGKEFQYINREKFSSYHTDLITSAEDFDGYKDGAVYHIEYVTKPNPFEKSPIDYYLPFQFFDVDFDGKKELLIITIYAMERIECGYDNISDDSYNYHYAEFCREKGLDPADDESREAYYDDREYDESDEEGMVVYAVSTWGGKWNDYAELFKFMKEHYINDMHAGNWGYRGGKLVMCDYGGFGSLECRRMHY